MFTWYGHVKNHLYNSENWTPTQLEVFSHMYNFDVLGWKPWKGVADYFYDTRKSKEWVKNNPDVPWHDPRNIPGIGASLTGSALGSLNFVSKNLERLYK